MREQSTVVYADVLGFSHLVTSMENHIDTLDGFQYATMSIAQLRESFQNDPIPNPLAQTFGAFHRTLDIHISRALNADPLQSIVFSDSAFVVFRDLNTAMWFAQSCMRTLISLRVPVRMGIGRGTFRGLRLTTDISDEVRRHSSQFLGTGVIRAHQAESCGLKGLRIFIHPDSEMTEDWPGDLCEVEDDAPQPKMVRRVIHELNYLEHHPDFSSTGPQTTNESHDELVAGVTKMMDRAPEQEKLHYQKTFAALARMRDAYEPRG